MLVDLKKDPKNVAGVEVLEPSLIIQARQLKFQEKFKTCHERCTMAETREHDAV